MITLPRSIYEAFAQTAKRHRNRPALYWKSGGVWHEKTYNELLSDVDRFAAQLGSLGVTKGTHVALWSENRPEWLISDLAVNKLGAVSVPVHAVSSADFVSHVLSNSESAFLIVSAAIYEKNGAVDLSGFTNIICLENSLPKDAPRTMRTFLDTVDIPHDATSATSFHELASIVYTSGTTGAPKGVLLTNENFLSNVEATCNRVPVFHTDLFLSFLPLSHILERTAGSYVPMTHGAAIAYVSSIADLPLALKEMRPTVLISVPKIFERIYEKVFDVARKGSPFKQKVFFWALDQAQKNGPTYTIASIIVYRQILASFGGRLRIAVSGGASIAPRILKFFSGIGLPIVEGYGLTETAAAAAANSLKEQRIGSVGRPLKNVEIRLSPSKEILIKGLIVTAGYWKNEEETRAALEDGWFRTGDLGYIDAEGYVTITGRIKEMIVSSNGKNISPEKIENLLNTSAYINQSLVVGHKRPFLTALIVPQMESFATESGEKPTVEASIKKDIDRVNESLAPYERIRRFYLLQKPFTIESNELTPTLKLRRTIIEAHHRTVIENLYIQ